MKFKYLLLVLTILSSSYTCDAQVKKWLKKAKDKIQSNEHVQKATESVKQIDPKKYIVKKINENYQLNQYVSDLQYKYKQLKRTLNSNINLYNSSKNNFSNDFYKTNEINSYLAYLEDGIINKKFRVIVDYDGLKYKLYSNKNYYIASAVNKMPLNQNLEDIIKSGYWASQTKNLNNSYIKNINTFSNLNAEFYGYMLLFYDQSINIFNRLNDIGYGGITAVTVIDEYSRVLGYGFSISGTESSFKSYRNKLKEMQELSKRINNSSSSFLKTKQKLNSNRYVNYNEVVTSLQAFKSISDDINTLADEVGSQRKAIAETRSELSQLSTFYGISFLESIGDMYSYLDDYYATIEEGTRQHAINFNDYVNNINSSANRLYNQSKSAIDSIANNQIAINLVYLNDYLSISSEIRNNQYRYLSTDSYVNYLNKVSILNSSLNRAKNEDFVEFHNVLKELKTTYDNFPINEAIEYYNTVLNNIDSKQIVGGNYLETYSASYKTIVSSILEDKANIAKLVAVDKNLEEYNAEATQSNIIFFSVIGCVVIIIIVIIVIILRRKKTKESHK